VGLGFSNCTGGPSICFGGPDQEVLIDKGKKAKRLGFSLTLPRVLNFMGGYLVACFLLSFLLLSQFSGVALVPLNGLVDQTQNRALGLRSYCRTAGHNAQLEVLASSAQVPVSNASPSALPCAHVRVHLQSSIFHSLSPYWSLSTSGRAGSRRPLPAVSRTSCAVPGL
jgi:hypothetical protein